MESLPPLTVNVSSRRPVCILDAQLALSRLGLLLAARLARELEVWICRALWEILDSSRYYLSHPSRLTPCAENDRGASSELVQALGHWQAARLEADIARVPIYWAGGVRYQSSLPPSCDEQLIPRFEALAAALEGRAVVPDGASNRDETDPWIECVRDALALAAALSPTSAIVLTRGVHGISAFNEQLGQAQIPSREIDGPSCEAIRAYYQPLFARAGLIELLWAGLELTAVQLVAPMVPLTAPEPPDAAGVDALFTPPARDNPDWWQDAEVFWWRISAN